MAGGVLAGVSLAAPVAAVLLAIGALRAGDRSAMTVLVVAGFLLFVVLVALPVLVVSASAVVAALALYVVVGMATFSFRTQ